MNNNKRKAIAQYSDDKLLAEIDRRFNQHERLKGTQLKSIKRSISTLYGALLDEHQNRLLTKALENK